MKLDQATATMLENGGESTVGGWWQAVDTWTDRQSLLHEVERHIHALCQLDSWPGMAPPLLGREGIGVMGLESDHLDTLQDSCRLLLSACTTGARGTGQTATLVREPQGQTLNEICALLLQLLEATYKIAITDFLTGLFNRRHFDERLAEETLRAARYAHPLSLIMLDIDHFKFYNDQFGHLEADRLLVQLARLLERSVRRTDVVARYGGDEFVILLPETDAEGARMVADKLRCAVQEPALWPLPWPRGQAGTEDKFPYCRVTISAGVATCRLGRSLPAELLASADRALYRAKSAGRNCVWGAEALTGDECMSQVLVESRV